MDQRATEDFEAFALARSGDLYRQAWALCGDPHRAEDLVQETLAKVFVKWRRIDTPYAYSQRTLLRTYLSRRRLRSSSELPSAEMPETAGTTDPMVDSDLRLILQEALAELSRLDRAVLVLRYLEDLSVADTAERLGLSPGAVKNRSLRALTQVREGSLR
ncbi:SigE family RNA polymerase sigma factor [Nocardioides mesophilus]|uniref:SigE family RNA polymerase sigma factor n=1 Tax=Nocardioides mesophilus TaxID=433659 RepID=A0A7G9RDI1_9ACTN|nr:SigE family RNA polymerase sigma factor [Nocardioides mesophilus]QNN53656.1 SigE family RNA polymerase sigma factor [Nocardioides mesophilus]